MALLHKFEKKTHQSAGRNHPYVNPNKTFPCVTYIYSISLPISHTVDLIWIFNLQMDVEKKKNPPGFSS